MARVEPSRVVVALAAAGAALALLGLLDPILRGPGLVGCALACAAAAMARRHGAAWPVLLAAAAVGFVVAAALRPEFRADAPGYYVYLRSLALDHDLDFSNEWAHWGLPPLPPTPTGRRPNLHPIGPALFWAPFFALAHLYVLATRLMGLRSWPADGYSTPYLHALAAGSISAVVAGGYLLARSMEGYLTLRQATLVVVGAVLTSSIAYYAFVVPGMAHALTFALTCLVVWAALEADRAPSLRAWSVLGLALGLVTLTRWQGLVLALLPAVLALRQLPAGRARPSWIGAAAGLALLAFAPQMLAWKLLFGHWLTMPQGPGYVDWSSPHFRDVLFSAERGFFDWTPVMLAGTAGLLLLVPARPHFALTGVAIVVATAWVNGGVSDWDASDAFAVWSAGLIRLYRTRVFVDAAPFDRLAGAQAHQLYRLLDAGAARLGPRARAFVYDVMVGEYFYYNVNPGGTIDVGAADSPWLAGGWSEPERRGGWPPFRWAVYPRACVRVPLQGPSALAGFVRARAPGRIPGQWMRILCNGAPIAATALSTEWADVPFTLPAESLQAGENAVCFEFARGLPGEAEGSNAAAVALVQLP